MWVDSSKASGSLGGLAMSAPISGSAAASAPSEREPHITRGQKQTGSDPAKL